MTGQAGINLQVKWPANAPVANEICMLIFRDSCRVRPNTVQVDIAIFVKNTREEKGPRKRIIAIAGGRCGRWLRVLDFARSIAVLV